jgi:hypothetical protein
MFIKPDLQRGRLLGLGQFERIGVLVRIGLRCRELRGLSRRDRVVLVGGRMPMLCGNAMLALRSQVGQP